MLKLQIECRVSSLKFGLKACLNYGHNFGLRLVSRLVRGEIRIYFWPVRMPNLTLFIRNCIEQMTLKNHTLRIERKGLLGNISTLTSTLESIKSTFKTFPPKSSKHTEDDSSI